MLGVGGALCTKLPVRVLLCKVMTITGSAAYRASTALYGCGALAVKPGKTVMGSESHKLLVGTTGERVNH